MNRVIVWLSMVCSVTHAMWFSGAKKDQSNAQNTQPTSTTVNYFQPVVYKNNQGQEFFIGYHTIVDQDQDRAFWLYDTSACPMMYIVMNISTGYKSISCCAHNFTWMNGHYGVAWEKSGVVSLSPADIFAHKDTPHYIGEGSRGTQE